MPGDAWGAAPTAASRADGGGYLQLGLEQFMLDGVRCVRRDERNQPPDSVESGDGPTRHRMQEQVLLFDTQSWPGVRGHATGSTRTVTEVNFG